MKFTEKILNVCQSLSHAVNLWAPAILFLFYIKRYNVSPHTPSMPLNSYGGGDDGGTHQRNAAEVVFWPMGPM